MAYVRGFGGGGYFSYVISMCVCLPCFRIPGEFVRVGSS
jgi:hypothetical protein